MPFINVSSTSNPRTNVTEPPTFKPNEPTTQSTNPKVIDRTVERKVDGGPNENVVNVETQLSSEGIKETKAQSVPNLNDQARNNNLQINKGRELENNFEQKLTKIEGLNKMSDEPQQNRFNNAQNNSINQPSNIAPSQLHNSQERINLPTRNTTFDFLELLKYGISKSASDIHLTVGYRPMIRVDGSLEIVNLSILTNVQINQSVLELIKTRHDMNISNIFEADLTYTYNNRRFRVNIFKEMSNFAIVMRIIPDKIVALEELGLPQVVKGFSNISNGLVLVTGPTGSGKSTTIASLLNLINITQPKHIVTLEDPIEFVFPKGLGLIDQREYGVDFTSWDNALRSVLRQDPDVVLIGEMRDLATIEAALQIAETGHLVFATLHTNGASETINRVIDVFDSQKQDQIRIQLSSVLKAVVSQKLIVLNGGGRKAAVEILISNASVKNAIRDKKTFQIDNIIQTNNELGMSSLEKSLVSFIRDGSISLEYAKTISSKPNELEILLKN